MSSTYIMSEEIAAQEATRCSGCSQAESGRCPQHLGPDPDLPSAAKYRDMRDALERSTQALDDWINTYASEFCDADRVMDAQRRIMDEGGTLAYIADVQEQNRQALGIVPPDEWPPIRAAKKKGNHVP